MKGSPCLCPGLPHFWQLGSCFMAEGSATQAPGKEPPLSIQVLRAQYEGLRRQQRVQAYRVVLPTGPPAETNARRFEKAPLTVQRQQTYSLWIPFQSYPRPCLPARVDNKLSCATRWQKQVPEKEERRRSGRSSSLSQCSPAPRSRSGRQCVPTAVSVGREERCQLPRRSCFEIPPSSFTAPWAVNPRWESQNQTPVSEKESFPLAGGCTPAPAESMVSLVWINKERRPSVSLEEADPEAGVMLEEADGGCLQRPESPRHTYLEMYRCVQTFQQETSLPVKHKDKLMGSEQRLPQEGDPGLLENNQMTQQGTTILQTAQRECPVGNTQTKAVGSGLNMDIQRPLSKKNPHRSGKPAHYPFPQRKTPRISQTARNLGLYGPA